MDRSRRPAPLWRRWGRALALLVVVWALLVVTALFYGSFTGGWIWVLIWGPILIVAGEGVFLVVFNEAFWERFDRDRWPWQRWLARALVMLALAALLGLVLLIWHLMT